jgi:hypothetical protein
VQESERHPVPRKNNSFPNAEHFLSINLSKIVRFFSLKIYRTASLSSRCRIASRCHFTTRASPPEDQRPASKRHELDTQKKSEANGRF